LKEIDGLTPIHLEKGPIWDGKYGLGKSTTVLKGKSPHISGVRRAFDLMTYVNTWCTWVVGTLKGSEEGRVDCHSEGETGCKFFSLF
jgi:hypothetical protein